MGEPIAGYGIDRFPEMQNKAQTVCRGLRLLQFTKKSIRDSGLGGLSTPLLLSWLLRYETADKSASCLLHL